MDIGQLDIFTSALAHIQEKMLQNCVIENRNKILSLRYLGHHGTIEIGTLISLVTMGILWLLWQS